MFTRECALFPCVRRGHPGGRTPELAVGEAAQPSPRSLGALPGARREAEAEAKVGRRRAASGAVSGLALLEPRGHRQR